MIKSRGKIYTINNWQFDPLRCSKEDLIEAREVCYHLWREYHGYMRFHVFRYFFQEIFKITVSKCRKSGKIMHFRDLIETERSCRASCGWDWVSDR